MYPSTEDLLRMRDGKPVDAGVRAAVDADPALRAQLEHLRQTQRSLRALPRFEPPPGMWEQIEAELQRDPPAAARWHWLLRGAIAASVAVLAILLLARSPEAPVDPFADAAGGAVPSTIVAESDGANGRERPLATPAYASLVAESARLERLLDGLTYQPRLINVGTATTIDGLQNRIAFIDEQLMYAAAYGAQPAQRQALWRERVDLMNALVQVRYAQAQRFGF